MDQNPLVTQRLPESERLVKSLRDAGVPITTAFWSHGRATGDWQLNLVTPRTDSEGPLSVYTSLQQLLANGYTSLALDDIRVRSPKDRFVQILLSPSFMGATREIDGVRYSRGSIERALSLSDDVDQVVPLPAA